MRGRRCAEFTIPSLLPYAGHTAADPFVTPYNSIGARGVNNLAAKLLLTLLPPNEAFFKLDVDDLTAQKIAQQPDAQTQIDSALATIERAIVHKIETRPYRPILYTALKQLLVSGNYLLFIQKDAAVRGFRLDQFVVRRDPAGHLLEIVIRECVDPKTLPEDVQKLIAEDLSQPNSANDEAVSEKAAVPARKNVDLFTYVSLQGKQYEQHQEIFGKIIPGSKAKYPMTKSAWLPLRWSTQEGEDYGRSYCEEYLGDLISAEELRRAVVQGAAIAAKILFLVKPNAVVKVDDLTDTESGGFVTAAHDDVIALQVDKRMDLQAASAEIQDLNNKLAFAFLLNTAIQRNGERVTAEEIRYMARELEDALGGSYSMLSQELQLPLIQRIMAVMQRAGEIPSLPENVVQPTITTGLDALGRGNDLNKLDQFLAGAAQAIGPQVLAQYLNVSDYLSRRATALGVNTEGLIKSQDEVQAEQQQQQQAAMAQQAIPHAIKGASDLMGKAMDQQPGPEANAQSQ